MFLMFWFINKLHNRMFLNTTKAILINSFSIGNFTNYSKAFERKRNNIKIDMDQCNQLFGK